MSWPAGTPHYLGPQGQVLTALPFLGRPVDSPAEIPAGVRQTLGGRQVVHTRGLPRRSITISRDLCTDAEWSTLRGMAYGAFGPPPLAWIEPSMVNLLGPNVSSGTDVTQDTTGFVMVSGVAVTSTTAQAAQGLRSAAWQVSGSGQFLRCVPSLTTSGEPANDIPIVGGMPYTFQVQARALAAINLSVAITFYDPTTSLATITGGSVALTTTGWQTVSVSTTAPAGATMARPRVNTASAVTTTVYVDKPQFEAGSVVSAWCFGAGVARVAFTGSIGHSLTGPGAGHTTALTLTEVG